MTNSTVQLPTMHDVYDPFEIFERLIPTLRSQKGEENLARQLYDTLEQLPNPKLTAERLVEQLILPQEEGQPRAYVGTLPSSGDPDGVYRKKRGMLMLRSLAAFGAVPMLTSKPSAWTGTECMHTLLLPELQKHAQRSTTAAGALLSFRVNAILNDGTHTWYVDWVRLRKTPNTVERPAHVDKNTGVRGTLRTSAVLELPAPGSLKPLVCGPMCHNHLVDVVVDSNNRVRFVS